MKITASLAARGYLLVWHICLLSSGQRQLQTLLRLLLLGNPANILRHTHRTELGAAHTAEF